MNKNILLLLPIFALYFCNCGQPKPSNKQRVIHDSTSCEYGRMQAEMDFRAGKLMMNEFGFPPPENEIYWDIMSKRYNITIKQSYGCEIDGEHVECYNEYMSQRIIEKYGNIFVPVRHEADSIYTNHGS